METGSNLTLTVRSFVPRLTSAKADLQSLCAREAAVGSTAASLCTGNRVGKLRIQIPDYAPYMPRPHNFSNTIKAKVFRLDRATCAYSGRRLWILDHGAAPGFPVDWADHIAPVSGGIGLSVEENCACADWRANKRKGAKTDIPTPLFRRGAPTEHYFSLDEKARAGLADTAYLERFARLEDSDWYFNRALFHVLMGVVYLAEDACVRQRGDLYYARAAIRVITKWQRLTAADQVPSLEERGLTPSEPAADQWLMLDIRSHSDLEEFRETMRALVPIYKAAPSRIDSSRVG